MRAVHASGENTMAIEIRIWLMFCWWLIYWLLLTPDLMMNLQNTQRNIIEPKYHPEQPLIFSNKGPLSLHLPCLYTHTSLEITSSYS